MQPSLEDYLRRTVTENRFIPVTPHPRQALFLVNPCLEVLFGGQAGGGKSAALLMAALQFVNLPGYSAVIFRRTFADLTKPGCLIPRCHEWLSNTEAKWHGDRYFWSFPSGATLSFAYLSTPMDKFSHQGTEYQFVGFDELTQQQEDDYRYLYSRMRQVTCSKIPLRMRSTSNPGGVGHQWVKNRFLTGAVKDKSIFLKQDGNEVRTFIPSSLADNPSLDAEQYKRGLAMLDHITRRQLEHGDWDIQAEGMLFKREWFQVVPVAPACRWVRYWDLAATENTGSNDPDWTAGALLGKSDDGCFYLKNIARIQGTPLTVRKLIRQTAELDGKTVPIAMEEEGGGSGKNVIDVYRREVLCGWSFQGVRPKGSKVERASPVSAMAEAGLVKLVAGSWNQAFLDEVSAFPTDGVHDDQVDATSGAFHFLTPVNFPQFLG